MKLTTGFNLMDQWRQLPLIPRHHEFKNLPLTVLDRLGWRWTNSDVPGMGVGYFIPYFDARRKTVPFAQTRHLAGDRRFTFLKDASPRVYGSWNVLTRKSLLVVEGTSDGAVLEHCGLPWIALPSASSASLVKSLAQYCKANDIKLIYAGDNDHAGDQLRLALNEVASYRLRQPPEKYKDWGDFYQAEAREAVRAWCLPYIEAKPLQKLPEAPQQAPEPETNDLPPERSEAPPALLEQITCPCGRPAHTHLPDNNCDQLWAERLERLERKTIQ